jgi:uncharacterized protein YrzB (UPF0473 family)
LFDTAGGGYHKHQEKTVSELEHDEEEETTIITLEDDDGNSEDFELLDVLEVAGQRYGIFAPLDEEEAADDEEDEGVIILRQVQDGEEEVYETIEDEEEFNRVAAHLDQLAQEQGLAEGGNDTR